MKDISSCHGMTDESNCDGVGEAALSVLAPPKHSRWTDGGGGMPWYRRVRWLAARGS